MTFPFWSFSGMNTGMLIAIVSVLHVFISQFAVGGGIYLLWMEHKARQANDSAMLDWLEKHTHFFLMVTMVFGGLSGVGIWFTISVVNPEAVSMLIHNFVFLWATEWVFFLLEILSLLAYYYTYKASRDGRMTPRAHMWIGFIYAFSGYMSLVIINGIITFMMTPGSGLVEANVWLGFFNPTYFPSLVFRTGICLTLAGMFAIFTATRIPNRETRQLAARISSKWIVLPFLLLIGGSVWYYFALPPDRHEALLRHTQDIQPFLLAYGWILPVAFLLGVLAYARAEKLRKPMALLVLCSGLVLVGSFEWVRETARRPWVADGLLYSNGITLDQQAQANTHGVASVSGWVRVLQEHESGKAALEIAPAEGLTHGALLFAQQCGSCHGLGSARIDIIPRVSRLTPVGLDAQLQGAGKRLVYMPPFSGNQADREALVKYLMGAANTMQVSQAQTAPGAAAQ